MNLHSGFKPYQCEQHSLRFHTKKALSDHVYQHNISYKASIPCNECNRLFLRKYVSCLNHRKLPCDECKNLFVKKYDSCVGHQKGRIHPCSGCKRLFSKMYADCSKHTLVCENQCGFKTTKGKKVLKWHSQSSKCDPKKFCFICLFVIGDLARRNTKESTRRFIQKENNMNAIIVIYNLLTDMLWSNT